MKIYIASSWQNKDIVLDLAELLKLLGHKVDCFCDEASGRYVFHFSEVGDIEKINAISFLEDHRTKKAFLEDKKWLDWCECLIMVLPCGNSAHLEAGYVVGQGKKLIIFGEFPMGQFDVMYGFADKLVKTIEELKKTLLSIILGAI